MYHCIGSFWNDCCCFSTKRQRKICSPSPRPPSLRFPLPSALLRHRVSAHKPANDDLTAQHISRLVNKPLNIFSEAAAGATSLASITSVVPLGLLMIMKLPPPRPEAAGLFMPWHRAVVIAESTALPPCVKIVKPAKPNAMLLKQSSMLHHSHLPWYAVVHATLHCLGDDVG